MLVPGDRPLAAQFGQGTVHVVSRPEVEARQVDLVERQGRGRRRDGAHVVLLPGESRGDGETHPPAGGRATPLRVPHRLHCGQA